jgi:hypothetical protein
MGNPVESRKPATHPDALLTPAGRPVLAPLSLRADGGQRPAFSRVRAQVAEGRTPATDMSCRTAFPPAAIQSAASSALSSWRWTKKVARQPPAVVRRRPDPRRRRSYRQDPPNRPWRSTRADRPPSESSEKAGGRRKRRECGHSHDALLKLRKGLAHLSEYRGWWKQNRGIDSVRLRRPGGPEAKPSAMTSRVLAARISRCRQMPEFPGADEPIVGSPRRMWNAECGGRRRRRRSSRPLAPAKQRPRADG